MHTVPKRPLATEAAAALVVVADPRATLSNVERIRLLKVILPDTLTARALDVADQVERQLSLWLKGLRATPTVAAVEFNEPNWRSAERFAALMRERADVFYGEAAVIATQAVLADRGVFTTTEASA